MFGSLLSLLLASQASAAPVDAMSLYDPEPVDSPFQADDEAPPTDTDGDGLPDELELQTGTSPIDADTDGDGVPDGVEDANQDGMVSPDETDPRRPGLFPGSGPHIPEPMFFDLVRGLGARQGELEVNVLLGLSRGADRRPTLEWAPEVEWAFADGWAAEFELPLADRQVEAVKGALQWTAPSIAPQIAHGVQLLGEYVIDTQLTEVSVLYLFGGRVGKTSLFAMAGPRLDIGAQVEPMLQANPSVFVDLDEAVTVGLEGNALLGKHGGPRTQVLGQVHWQISHAFRVQVGGGLRAEPARTHPVGVMRLILE